MNSILKTCKEFYFISRNLVAEIDLPPEKNYNSVVFNPYIYPINKILFPNPLHSTYIFCLSKTIGTLIELKDSFPEKYETTFGEGLEEAVIKQEEEKMVSKRFILSHRYPDTIQDEFTDFCWDSYNNIYLAQSNQVIYCLNLSLQYAVTDENKRSFVDGLKGTPTCIVLTQRYLVVATDQAEMCLVNIFIPEKELPSFKSSLGNPDNYKL